MYVSVKSSMLGIENAVEKKQKGSEIGCLCQGLSH